MAIRVLIVDDAAPVREAVRRMLEMERDFLVVGEAADGEEAVQAARRLRPDVILMDVNMPRLDGIQAARTILAEADTSVIMVSVEGDLDYLRRAMQSGARDYLVKPFTPEDLFQAVRRAARGRQAAPERQGRVITVFGTKGGVGRSTIAVNLAAALALGDRKRRVALLDLDLEFGVLSQFLSLKPGSSLVDLCRLPEPVTAAKLEEAMVRHPELGLHLLAAPPDPHLAAEVDGDARPDRARNYAEEIVRAARAGWDAVVVDTGTSFRDATLAALDLADVVLLVTVPDVPALHNTAKALNILLNQLEYPAEKIRLIVNHADAGGGLKVEDVAESLDFPVALALPEDRTVAQAVNAGQPVVGRRVRSPFGQGIGRLADLLGRPEEGEGRERGWLAFGGLRRPGTVHP